MCMPGFLWVSWDRKLELQYDISDVNFGLCIDFLSFCFFLVTLYKIVFYMFNWL